MRLFTALIVTATLALGCSSNSGGGATTGSGGSAGSAAGGSAAGGSGAGGAGGSAGSAAGGSSATDAGTADTYANFAKGFFGKYCVPCHNSNDVQRDYSTMTDITRDHSVIACGVATTKLAGCASFPPPEQFPIGNGPKPTNTERDRLVAWIQAGMPQ